MSDLVLGLLVLGAVLFAGVLAYNRLQERAARRAAERAFRSQHSDVLLEEPPRRVEPTLAPAAAAKEPMQEPHLDALID